MKKRHLFVLFFLGFISTVCSASDIRTFDSLANEINKHNFTDRKKSKGLVEKLYEVASKTPENKVLIPQCLYWEAYLNYSQGINDSTLIPKIKTNLELFEGHSNQFEIALLHQALALGSVVDGDYADGLTHSLKALMLFKQLDNSLFAARVSQLLGVICYRTRNFAMAEKFYSESFFSKMPRLEYYKTSINRYSAWLFIPGRQREALDSMQRLLPILETIKDTGLLVVASLNTGGCYYLNSEPEKALEYYNRALHLAQTIDNSNFRVSLYLNLGGYLINTQSFKDARQYLENAKNIALLNDNKEQLSGAYSALSYLYSQLGNIDSAYFYITKYNALRDELLNNSKTIEAYQAYVSATLESARQELTIANQKITLKNRYFAITIISALGIILLIILFMVVVQQKKRRQALIKEAEKRELEDRLMHEQKIQQLEKEKHQEILESKIREITSYSLLLSNKNNTLQQISMLTQQLQKAKKEETETLTQEIRDAIHTNLNTDNERNNFMHHFNNVHPSFFDKLKSLCDDLTENNLRMCAYFRIGMSAKQVAQILNVSAETIKNGRYRLKKKLNLLEEANLDDFLRSI